MPILWEVICLGRVGRKRHKKHLETVSAGAIQSYTPSDQAKSLEFHCNALRPSTCPQFGFKKEVVCVVWASRSASAALANLLRINPFQPYTLIPNPKALNFKS